MRHALQPAGLFLQGFEQTDTWLSIAIKIVKAHLKSCIISSSADQAAVILYGTVRAGHAICKHTSPADTKKFVGLLCGVNAQGG